MGVFALAFCPGWPTFDLILEGGTVQPLARKIQFVSGLPVTGLENSTSLALTS